MKTVEPIIVSSLSEASEADVADGALAVISAPDASAATGYTTKKSLLSRIKDYIIGKTSISGVGDGTVTGAISSLNSDLTKLFVKDVSLGSVTFDAGGYKSIVSSFPTTPTGYRFCFALLWSYATASTHDAVSVAAAGNYLLGTGGATVTNVVIRYVFCNNLES